MNLTNQLILDHLELGLRIRRKSWPKSKYLIQMTPESDVSALFTEKEEPWVPSIRQLTADDWECIANEITTHVGRRSSNNPHIQSLPRGSNPANSAPYKADQIIELADFFGRIGVFKPSEGVAGTVSLPGSSDHRCNCDMIQLLRAGCKCGGK